MVGGVNAIHTLAALGACFWSQACAVALREYRVSTQSTLIERLRFASRCEFNIFFHLVIVSSSEAVRGCTQLLRGC